MARHILNVFLCCVSVLLFSGTPLNTVAARVSDSTKRIVIAFGGDILLDRGIKPAIRRFGVKGLFAGVREHITAADYAIANLECPLTMERCPLRKRFCFRADTTCASALRGSGWTHLSMANNHTNDQGRDGVITTAEVLTNAGIRCLGYGASQSEAAGPVILEKNGISVAVFASVPLPLENWMCREDLPGPCQATVSALCDSIRSWKRAHPGHRVAVFLHWGREHVSQPEPEQIVDAHALIDAGADVVLGQHPHVVQSIEEYNGGVIIYSLGNLLFDQYHAPENEGVLALIVFAETGPVETALVPLLIDKRGPVSMSAGHVQNLLARMTRLSPSVRLELSSDKKSIRVKAISKDG